MAITGATRSLSRAGSFEGIEEEVEPDLEFVGVVSRQVVAQAPSLDILSQQASERTGRPWSLRWILTHMVEEYARCADRAPSHRVSPDSWPDFARIADPARLR